MLKKEGHVMLGLNLENHIPGNWYYNYSKVIVTMGWTKPTRAFLDPYFIEGCFIRQELPTINYWTLRLIAIEGKRDPLNFALFLANGYMAKWTAQENGYYLLKTVWDIHVYRDNLGGMHLMPHRNKQLLREALGSTA